HCKSPSCSSLYFPVAYPACLRRPPTSPLFPYTTLFRSNLDPAFTIGNQLIEPIRRHMKVSRREASSHATALLERVGISQPERVIDRKSTRLNSSHVSISYAVFCLKKQKTKIETT